LLYQARVPELHAEKVERWIGVSHSVSCQSAMLPERLQLPGNFNRKSSQVQFGNANRGSEHANHIGREMK